VDSAAPAPRRRRRWWVRLLLWSLGVIVVLALVGSGLGVWSVRRAFPDYGGTLRLSGLSGPVTVYRDRFAIPQVYARTADDLYRAQGYLHAEERFWEMDFRRHVTAGRLGELFGADQVDTDTYLRTLGWRRVAEAEWGLISSESKGYLTAYASGVNAWLVEHGVLDREDSASGPANGAVSLEYTVLGLQNGDYRIERWDPVDSLAWLKAMAWDLRGNMTDEFERSALLAAGLTREQIDTLYPQYPFSQHRPIVDGGTVANGAFVAQPPPAPASNAPRGAAVVSEGPIRAAAPALDAIRAGLAKLPPLVGEAGSGIGSNSWVIGGARTSTGKPILANDPHLGPTLPGIWMQMGLHCDCGVNVEGFTFSGLPGVVIGHNDRIAWGFTNLGPDVTDFYLERVDGNRYQVDGAWQDLTVRQETIKVAGGKPVTITVRSTKHGPLLSDASKDLRDVWKDNAVALRWTALDPGRTVEAVFALNAARDWADFRRAAALFEVPAQNMVYADVDGNIGYQSPGRIPLRGKGDGKWPNPGWDPAYDWTGYVPFDELPTVRNPSEGYIVTANNAVVGPQYPRFLTDDWSYGYRSQRITDLVSAASRVSLDDVQKMQFDNRNNLAPELVPALLNASVTGMAERARAMLKGWDFQQGHDSAPAAYFNAVWRHLLRKLFDELPADYPADGGDRWFTVVRGLLGTPTSPWWDVKGTSAAETAPDVLAAALTDAAAELSKRDGDDPAKWRWGALHQLSLQNQTFGRSGIGLIEWLFNAPPVDTAGGKDTVNATGWDAPDGYAVDWVPSMRMIVNLGDLDNSRWVNLTGVSGHAFTDHYYDQTELWRTGQMFPMRWNRDTIQREAAHTQTLRP
jgi:penicillin amidase